MNILILTNYANGLWLFRKELLIAFLEDGHKVSVSLPPDENVEKLKTIQLNGSKLNIIETPFERRGNNPVKDFGLFKTYMKLLKSENPDVVLTYTIKPNLYGGLACRISRVPYICNITGLGTAIENEGLLSKILLKFYAISMKKAKCVFFQNAGNRDFMNDHNVARNNNKMLPGSGINLSEHPFMEYPSDEENGKITFLTVGRIMKDKGIDEYLEAAKTIKERYSNVEFWLVGDYEDDEREHYEPLIKSLEDNGIIIYYGHSDNVQNFMAQSHAVVHPSYHEGLSNVLLEADACGRPVLAGNISGCKETFVDGVSGFAFETKNIQSLVEAMEKFISLSYNERKNMGIAGRRWVEEKFDRNIVLQAYRDELGTLKGDKI
jgi:galacturonosyltransferase